MADRPLALFRCDGGPALGAGHVMRCLALAERLENLGWRTRFAVGADSKLEILDLHQPNRIVLAVNDGPDELRQQLGSDCALLVVDHYGLDAAFESGCRAWASRICVFDDLADRPHDCDVLVDFTPGRPPDAYDGKVPTGCRILIGPNYAPLRQDFFRARIEPPDTDTTNTSDTRPHLLIAPGATDPTNIAGHALAGIREAELDVGITVTLGADAPHRREVAKRLEEMNGTLLVDCSEMAREIARSDLVFGAGGMSAWERCCLGAPSLMAVSADNQKANARALETAGAVRVIETPDDGKAVAHAIAELLEDRTAMIEMAKNAGRICDGLGSSRLALAIGRAPKAKDGKAVGLRPARDDDAAIMLDWQRHPETRRFARNPAVPADREHQSWFSGKLADPRCVFNIVTHDDKPAGVLRFDYRDEKQGFEVSILTAPDRYGLGIAGHALTQGRLLLDGWDLYAYVAEANETSRRLFQSAGYLDTDSLGWLMAAAAEEPSGEPRRVAN